MKWPLCYFHQVKQKVCVWTRPRDVGQWYWWPGFALGGYLTRATGGRKGLFASQFDATAHCGREVMAADP